jgi:pyridoxal phosphate enzyme (YggS family)
MTTVRLRERILEVEGRIVVACARSGRARADVTLVAVTKTISIEIARALLPLGISHLGESRPQELWKKAEAIPNGCHWHLIGHLQRNKVERTLKINPFIHSVDNLPVVMAIDKEAARQGKDVDVLLEVNASGEQNKHGFAPNELTSVLEELPSLRRVRVHGLMTMAAFEEDTERSRPTFAKLRDLSERHKDRVPPPHRLTELSMGMTNDFEVAIEEGATLVRIGTALFKDVV